MRALNRRQFLAAAGLGGSMLFMPSAARGAVAGPPQRLLLRFGELGPEIKALRMRPPGSPASILAPSSYDPDYDAIPDDYGWSFGLGGLDAPSFSNVLRPLHAVRDKTLVLEGLSLATVGLDAYGDGHAMGWRAVSTGAPAAGADTGQKSRPSQPSIDQRIKTFLRSQDPTLTDLASLELGVGYYQGSAETGGFHHWFYRDDGNGNLVRVPVQFNMRTAFDATFGGGTGTGAQGNERLDLLSFLHERYGALFPRLSQADRQKLELHRSLLGDLQSRLALQATLTCNTPTRPSGNLPWMTPAERDSNFLLNLANAKNIVAAAFACGVTRVASLQLQLPPTSLTGAGVGVDYHEVYSHGSNPPDEFNPGRAAAWAAARAVQEARTTWEMGVVADIAQTFAGIPDGDGTLLDHTLIVYMNEISHGGHGHDQWPAVIVGGAPGWRMGRYIRFPRNNPIPNGNNYGQQFIGQPHSQLLISLCQAMGLPIDSLGPRSVEGRVGDGPFQGMSRVLSLTGRLEALY